MKQPGKELTHEDPLQALCERHWGATAIEYGLIAALIAVACITIMTTLGTNLSAKFKVVSDKLAAANP